MYNSRISAGGEGGAGGGGRGGDTLEAAENESRRFERVPSDLSREDAEPQWGWRHGGGGSGGAEDRGAEAGARGGDGGESRVGSRWQRDARQAADELEAKGPASAAGAALTAWVTDHMGPRRGDSFVDAAGAPQGDAGGAPRGDAGGASSGQSHQVIRHCALMSLLCTPLSS